MVSLAAIAYYAFLFVGGIGFGYFTMRLTNPDSRLMPPTQKLGASALYGFALFSIAFAVDYFISGEARFFEAAGFLPVTLFFTVLLVVFFFKMINALSKPQYLVVGIPAVKTPPAQMDFDKSLALMPKAQAVQKPEERPKMRDVSFREIMLPAPKQAAQSVAKPVLQQPSLTPPVSKLPQAQEKQLPQAKIEISKTAAAAPAIPPSAPLAPTGESGLLPPSPPSKSGLLPPSPPSASGQLTPSPTMQKQKDQSLSQIDLQFEPRARTPEKRAGGAKEFFEGIRTALGVQKKNEGQEAHIPIREAVKPPVQQKKEGATAPLVREDIPVRESELKKIKEVELEQIASDISGEEKTGEETPVPHRRYMEKQAASAETETEKRKEREASPEEEFETMVQEVYNQLQLSKTRVQVSDNLKLSPPPAEAGVQERAFGQTAQPAVATAPGVPSSLFSSPLQAPAQSSAQPSSIFEQLNAISSSTPQQPKTEGDVKFVKVPANGAGCPRCHASNSRIVFCPYCGSGMCANCTPLIAPKEDGFDYSCPKCGENVFVKRQAQ